jgi:hypothetical protein
MTCPRCNADGDHIAEHGDTCQCGACGHEWNPRPMTARKFLDTFGWPDARRERDAFNTDTGERCEPAVARWVPGRARPWE